MGGELQLVGAANLSSRLDWLLGLDSAVLADFLNYTAQEGNAEIKQHVVLNINNGATGRISNVRSIPTYDFIRTPSTADLVKDSRTAPKWDAGALDVETTFPPAGTSIMTNFGPAYDRMVTLVTGQTRADRLVVGQAEEGITIEITPVVGTELVTADILIDARSVIGFDEMDRPIIASQRFETSITLKDKQSLHAATIERVVDVKERRGIPGLRKIPVLKHLFSTEKSRVSSSKIFVIITPCYCEAVSYEARLKGGPGDILKFKDTAVPVYIPRSDR